MASTPVFLGRWTDYSVEVPNRDVITMTVRDGALVIAALSTFVGLVGTAFWTLIAFCLHQCSAREDPQDGFYFQQQAMYRNAGTPIAALTDALKMAWAWQMPRRKPQRITKLKARSIILALPPLLIFVGFTLSGVFVGKVAGKAYSSNNVLVKRGRCGLSSFNGSTIQGSAARTQKYINDTLAARAYATECYDNNLAAKSSICAQYTLSTLPWSAENISCPFGQDPLGEDLCLPGQNTAYQLNTPSLDSNDVFGINAPKEDRVTISKHLTCAPLRIKNYVTTSVNNGSQLYFVNLGPVRDVSNWTYLYNSRLATLSVGYQLTSVFASSRGWTPVTALQIPEGDVTVHFMNPNSLSYYVPVDDPFFAAHIPWKLSANFPTVYLSDNYVYAMGCVDQYQICNPNTSPPSCTSQGNLNQTWTETSKLGLNAHQRVTAVRLYYAFAASSTYFTVDTVGSSALLARNKIYGTFQSTGLPVNQWQIEVEGWFKTSLAKIQAYVLEYVANKEDLGPYGTVLRVDPSSTHPEDQAAIAQCSQQRIRNIGGYQTFSFLGLLIIICVGSFIIFLSWIVEPLVGCYRRLRKNKSTDYKEVSRIADKTFQLQRMALAQGLENDRWEKQMEYVPVTKAEMTFMPPVRTRVEGVDDYRYGQQGWPLIEVRHHGSKMDY